MVVHCAGNAPEDIPSPAILAMQEFTFHQRRQVASAQLKHQDKDVPNPQSQSFSQSCGSVLPTSLIYFVLSIRGYKPWRPDAVTGTTRAVTKSVLRLFKGSWERTGHLGRQGAYPQLNPISR